MFVDLNTLDRALRVCTGAYVVGVSQLCVGSLILLFSPSRTKSMSLHGSMANLGCNSMQLLVHEELSTTWRVYLKWEEMNDRVSNFLIDSYQKMMIYAYSRKDKEQLKTIYTSIEASGGAPKLTSLSFQVCTLEEKRIVAEHFPHIAVEFIKKKRAHRIIQNFGRAWAVWYRSNKTKQNGHTCMILSNKTANKNEATKGNQVCWVLNKIKLKTLVNLYNKYSPNDFEFLDMNASSWNGLYILWLINPAILSLLMGVFVSCDLVLPRLKRLILALVSYLRRLVCRLLNRKQASKTEKKKEN